MTGSRYPAAASQPPEQPVHAARRVADSVLTLYPVPDLSSRTESPRRHLIYQLPLLPGAQKARLALSRHRVGHHLRHPSTPVPTHPLPDSVLVRAHCRRRPYYRPSLPHQPKPVQPSSHSDVLFCQVPCLQRLRRILRTPIDSKRPTLHLLTSNTRCCTSASTNPLYHSYTFTGLFIVAWYYSPPVADLRPGVAKGHGPVEDEGARPGVDGVDAEVADALELIPASRLGAGQARLQPAPPLGLQ